MLLFHQIILIQKELGRYFILNQLNITQFNHWSISICIIRTLQNLNLALLVLSTEYCVINRVLTHGSVCCLSVCCESKTICIRIMAEITNLNELRQVSDNDFTATFINSINNIFAWAQCDIINTLNDRDQDLLVALRNQLSDQIKEVFPTMSGRMPVNRRVKHLIVKDIFIMGESLTKETITNDLEKVVFLPNGEFPNISPGDENESTQANSLSVIIAMLKELQSAVSDISTENRQLREKIDSLNTNKCACKCIDPTRVTPSQSVEANQAVVTPGGSNAEVASELGVQTSCNPSTSGSINTINTVKPLTAAAPRNTAKTNPPPSTPSPTKKELYVGNVDGHNSGSDIASHLRDKGIDIATSAVRPLRQGQDVSSFCVKLPEKDFNKAVSSDQPIWPKGIKVRPFLENAPKGLRSGKPTNKHQNSNGFQPFRPQPKRRNPWHNGYTPRNSPQYERFASDRYYTNNRFSALQYEEHDRDYEEDWPTPSSHVSYDRRW